MRLWKLITHHDDPQAAFDWSVTKGRIAIGWGKVGDLERFCFASDAEITDAVRRKCFPLKKNYGVSGGQLRRFWQVMEEGDIVMLTTGGEERIRRTVIMQVQGSYEYKNYRYAGDAPVPDSDYQHQRCVMVRNDVDASCVWNLFYPRSVFLKHPHGPLSYLEPDETNASFWSQSLEDIVPGSHAWNFLPSVQASDLAEPPETKRGSYVVERVIRDTALARKVKGLHNNKCQICGKVVFLHDKETYSEAHHIKPLSSEHGGPDVLENIICVCPNCHVQLDYGAVPLNKETLQAEAKHSLDGKYIDYHNTK